VGARLALLVLSLPLVLCVAHLLASLGVDAWIVLTWALGRRRRDGGSRKTCA
jgi:hypothetical protein